MRGLLVTLLLVGLLAGPLGAQTPDKQPAPAPAPQPAPKKVWPPEIRALLDWQPWIRAQVGDEATYRLQIDFPWQKVTMKLIQKVVAVGNLEAEVESSMEAPGIPQGSPTRAKWKRAIRLEEIPLDIPANAPFPVRLHPVPVEIVPETLELFGRAWKTHRLTYRGDSQQGAVKTVFTFTNWVSTEAPLTGMVKMATHMVIEQGGTRLVAESTLTLLRFKRDEAGRGTGDPKAPDHSR